MVKKVVKMFMTSKLEGKCPKCSDEELYWWKKDETESIIEAYLNCDSCGKGFNKIIVDKDEDTSDKAIKKKLKQRHNIKEV